MTTIAQLEASLANAQYSTGRKTEKASTAPASTPIATGSPARSASSPPTGTQPSTSTAPASAIPSNLSARWSDLAQSIA
jgi:hypothetical protein